MFFFYYVKNNSVIIDYEAIVDKCLCCN